MGLGNFGMGEMLVILLLVLLLFGAKRIPEIAGSMGKGIREFKKNITDVERSFKEGEQGSQPIQQRQPDPLDRPRATETESRDREEPRRLMQ